MIRTLDVLFSSTALALGLPLFIVLYAIGLLDTGSPIFTQERVGRYKIPFRLIKFRTMRIDTVSVASHLVHPSAITSYGNFLRKTKLDELPQLWNVVKGDMSLVGPRPGLRSQQELTTAREQLGVYLVSPGITGLAQINAIDMSTPKLLAETDAKMIETLSVRLYLKYILLTFFGRGRGDAVKR